jgi:hypothetical protein
MKMHLKPNIAVYSDLKLEVGNEIFYLLSNGDKIFLKFDSLAGALKIFRNMHHNISNSLSLENADNLLNQLNLTLYVNRRWLAVAGYKKNILLYFLLKRILGKKKV